MPLSMIAMLLFILRSRQFLKIFSKRFFKISVALFPFSWWLSLFIKSSRQPSKDQEKLQPLFNQEKLTSRSDNFSKSTPFNTPTPTHSTTTFYLNNSVTLYKNINIHSLKEGCRRVIECREGVVVFIYTRSERDV